MRCILRRREEPVPVWSNSRLGSFEKCPLQYRYRYIDRIKREIFGIEAFMGNRVHEALEFLYQEVGKKRLPRVDAVVAHYHARWAAEYDAAKVRIVRTTMHADDYRQEGENCVRYFYDTTKNRRRRWCSMDGCGSRAKAAAYYRRRKAGESA